MSDARVRGIVLAHGAMAEGLVDAVHTIAGVEDALVAVSNRGLSPTALVEEIRGETGHGPAIVFTDLPSGSCGVAARLLTRHVEDLAVICGVNLPMLLDFVTHRDLPFNELVPRLVDRAKAAILSVPARVESNGDPAL